MVENIPNYKRRLHLVVTTAVVSAVALLIVIRSGIVTDKVISFFALASALVAVGLWSRFKDHDLAKKFGPAFKIKILGIFMVAAAATVEFVGFGRTAVWILLGAALFCFVSGTVILGARLAKDRRTKNRE